MEQELENNSLLQLKYFIYQTNEFGKPSIKNADLFIEIFEKSIIKNDFLNNYTHKTKIENTWQLIMQDLKDRNKLYLANDTGGYEWYKDMTNAWKQAKKSNSSLNFKEWFMETFYTEDDRKELDELNKNKKEQQKQEIRDAEQKEKESLELQVKQIKEKLIAEKEKCIANKYFNMTKSYFKDCEYTSSVSHNTELETFAYNLILDILKDISYNSKVFVITDLFKKLKQVKLVKLKDYISKEPEELLILTVSDDECKYNIDIILSNIVDRNNIYSYNSLDGYILHCILKNHLNDDCNLYDKFKEIQENMLNLDITNNDTRWYIKIGNIYKSLNCILNLK